MPPKRPGRLTKNSSHAKHKRTVNRGPANARGGDLPAASVDRVMSAYHKGVASALPGRENARLRKIAEKAAPSPSGETEAAREDRINWVMAKIITTTGPEDDALTKLAAEKIALRRALAVLGATTPRVVAEALGVGVSTLYAYGDISRANRPGPEQLRELALLFRVVSDTMAATSSCLSELAKVTLPITRGRRPIRRLTPRSK